MKQRPISLLLLILSVVAAGYFAYRWRQAESGRIQTIRWTHFVMDSLGTTLTPPGPPIGAEGRDSVYWQWVATTAQLQSRRWQQAVRHWVELRSTLLDEADITDLKRQGLENPPRQLRESLVAHAELIPYPASWAGKCSSFLTKRSSCSSRHTPLPNSRTVTSAVRCSLSTRFFRDHKSNGSAVGCARIVAPRPGQPFGEVRGRFFSGRRAARLRRSSPRNTI